MPRFYCPAPLTAGALLDLPASAARHVQVLRLQPGDAITLFDGEMNVKGQFGEYTATVTHMGRSSVEVKVGEFAPTQRETARRIHLAVGMPANDRMDWLVEKATELGVASIQPLMTERSVLKLAGERAGKKQAHWQSVAIAACEQCGSNRVPVIHAVTYLTAWFKAWPVVAHSLANQTQVSSLLLSLRAQSVDLREAITADTESPIVFLSGPEGGLSVAEENAAIHGGFQPVTLGPRVLRAETAALAVLAALQI
jgi:16S rRNA (uracil1498-N3)-methyltransferase